MRRTALITTVVLLLQFVAAVGKSSYLTAFNNLYGTADKRLDTCNTCHVNGFDRNPYGSDFETKLNELGDVTQALQAIEGIDSDTDTDTNIQEILAGTFPGDPSSNLPVEASTWGKIKALYE
ncbi:MAG: hypothetical protein JSW58_13465 [Candidatus Latescibacterota bacterium]|nr:MAG: hypothetical protein JSW58_13465 [Candidatus Latescibacterota bacterium]